MALNFYSAPVAMERSDNPASVLTRAKRALKHLGLGIRKAKEGQDGPYLIVKGDLILGYGEASEIAQWAKEQPVPAKAAEAAPAAAATETAASFA